MVTGPEDPYRPPRPESPRASTSPTPKRPPRAFGCVGSLLLGIVALVAFYFSMFWGWASGAGSPPNHEPLSRLAGIAFWVAAVAFVLSIAWGARSIRRR
jgi:membrane associated rhomboid family serine protease